MATPDIKLDLKQLSSGLKDGTIQNFPALELAQLKLFHKNFNEFIKGQIPSGIFFASFNGLYQRYLFKAKDARQCPFMANRAHAILETNKRLKSQQRQVIEGLKKLFQNDVRRNSAKIENPFLFIHDEIEHLYHTPVDIRPAKIISILFYFLQTFNELHECETKNNDCKKIVLNLKQNAFKYIIPLFNLTVTDMKFMLHQSIKQYKHAESIKAEKKMAEASWLPWRAYEARVLTTLLRIRQKIFNQSSINKEIQLLQEIRQLESGNHRELNLGHLGRLFYSFCLFNSWFPSRTSVLIQNIQKDFAGSVVFQLRHSGTLESIIHQIPKPIYAAEQEIQATCKAEEKAQARNAIYLFGRVEDKKQEQGPSYGIARHKSIKIDSPAYKEGASSLSGPSENCWKNAADFSDDGVLYRPTLG